MRASPKALWTKAMNILIDANTVYIAASTAKMFGVDLSHLVTQACKTESFNEKDSKEILKWSYKKKNAA